MSIGKIGHFDPSTDDWNSYIECLKHYFIANEIPEGRQKSTLLAICGPDTFELARNLVQPTKLDDSTYDNIVDKLTGHYSPRQSPIVQRFKFHSRQRQPGESVSMYIAALRAMGEHCDFGQTLNDMIRDRLVCGVNDRNIQ